MFTIKLHSEEYKFRFKHDIKHRKTFCEIQKVIGLKSEESIFEVTQRCSKKDQFTKSIGRKLALTKALDRFSSDIYLLSKSDRAYIWNKYFSLSKIK